MGTVTTKIGPFQTIGCCRTYSPTFPRFARKRSLSQNRYRKKANANKGDSRTIGKNSVYEIERVK